MEIIDCATCIGTRAEDERELDASVLLAEMDCAGVAESLCTHWAAVRYDARIGNDELLAICRREPRLHPVAVVSVAPHLGVAEEIARCARAGVVGFRFMPGAQGWVVESAAFAAALEAVEECGLPLAVELAAPGDATRLGRLSENLGVPLVLANVSYSTLGEAIAAMGRHGSLYLEACRLVTPGAVELLVSALGVQRLLFGSGAPAWEIIPTIAMVRAAGIAEEDKRDILGQNARRLYHLGLRGSG